MYHYEFDKASQVESSSKGLQVRLRIPNNKFHEKYKV